MNEPRSPLDAALDIVVFAPLGLTLAVGEELSRLAAKGRAKVEPQAATARMVGQFAVAEGRRRVTGLTDRRPPGHTTPPPDTPLHEEAAVGDIMKPLVTDPAAPGPGHLLIDDSVSSEGLAIPGYDSLSASQVIQRLAGLSPEELGAVDTYERRTRGRRTILTRISQLQLG